MLVGPAQRRNGTPNPWGLYDMIGNGWEWCHDKYDKEYYKRSPKKDPYNFDGMLDGNYVLRGDGSSIRAGSVTNRYSSSYDWEGDYFAFRVVRVKRKPSGSGGGGGGGNSW